MSVAPGVVVAEALNSKAHCCLAPSIWRRLLMQAFCCEVVRARTKLGIVMAARRPMMATTIMISTRVKPDLREVLRFIRLLFFSACGVNVAAGGLSYYYDWPFTHCLLPTALGDIAETMP